MSLESPCPLAARRISQGCCHPSSTLETSCWDGQCPDPRAALSLSGYYTPIPLLPALDLCAPTPMPRLGLGQEPLLSLLSCSAKVGLLWVLSPAVPVTAGVLLGGLGGKLGHPKCHTGMC